MVLQEADETALERGVGAQVGADGVGAVVQQTVVEPFVVAVVEALLLEGPFEVPVGLGDEEETGWRARTRGMTYGQKSSAGVVPARSPQVFPKMSFISSMAMSQRTPSAWSPMDTRVSTAASRNASLKPFSWTTSGQGGK